MLGNISGIDVITDMRKSIDGLCDIVQNYLKAESEQNCLYLFCGRKKDRTKALLIKEDGITLLYKRLTGIGNYKWSRNKDEVRNLTCKQFTSVTNNNMAYGRTGNIPTKSNSINIHKNFFEFTFYFLYISVILNVALVKQKICEYKYYRSIKCTRKSL